MSNKKKDRIETDVNLTLKGFNDYSQFIFYCNSLFDLETSEYFLLYELLTELQGDHDPMGTLLFWKNNSGGKSPEAFVRFMIMLRHQPEDEYAGLEQVVNDQ